MTVSNDSDTFMKSMSNLSLEGDVMITNYEKYNDVCHSNAILSVNTQRKLYVCISSTKATQSLVMAYAYRRVGTNY